MKLKKTLTNILEKYPIQNKLWSLIGGKFVSDISWFNGVDILDPWKRRFTNNGIVIKDDDGEILEWELTTTVEGQKVVCKLFND